MTSERPDARDRLLDEALNEGRPSGAEADAELRALLGVAETVHDDRERILAEADAAFPAARARFRAMLAESQQPSPVVVAAPAKRPRTLLAFRPRWATAMAAAAAALVIAFLVVPMLSNNVDTAEAQVLTPGDVVQVEGIVESVSDDPSGGVRVASDFGPVMVNMGDGTAINQDGNSVRRADLRPGDHVIVSGLVDSRRKVAADAVEIGQRNQPRPPHQPLTRLNSIDEAFDARLAAVVTSEDGATVRVVLVAGERRLFAEMPAGDALARFAGGAMVGQDVRVQRPAADQPRPFDIHPRDAGGPGRLVTLTGIVKSAGGGTLAVATLEGGVRVMVTEHTVVRPGPSHVDLNRVREGRDLVGHGVVVVGRLDPLSGDLVADVIAFPGMPRP